MNGRVNFFRQLRVLTSRYATLLRNDKMTIAALFLQAPVMALVLKLVGQRDCFTSPTINYGSQTVLFVLTTMAAFMGLLTSYREICREGEIIRRESAVGVSILATLLSKVAVLAAISMVQALILTAGFFWTVEFLPGQDGVLMPMPAEIYITILLILIASEAMGFLISAAVSSGEAAVLPLLLVVISQVVLCGVFFKLEGGARYIYTVVVNRWGMGALAATCDLNDRIKWLKLDQEMYASTPENLMNSWEMLALLALSGIIIAYILMRRRYAPKEK